MTTYKAPKATTQRAGGTMVIYKDKKKEWRWRLIRGSKIIADSGEGYTNKFYCHKMALTVVNLNHVKVREE